MKLSGKNRLMSMHRELFPDDTLFHRIARTVCRACVLPRKELYEAWEMARQVRGEYVGHHMDSFPVISRAGTGIPARNS